MKTYEVLTRYLCFTLKDGKKKQDYFLKKGNTLEAPENHMAIKALVAQKQIREVETVQKQSKE